MLLKKLHFTNIALLTIVLTLFLITVGGFVRASGSGLGCPDWPKCYGLWIPPTSAEQLPADYDPAEFNATKTWIEYINRLIGVLIGFSILGTAISSLQFRKTRSKITAVSFIALVMVVFQAWIGGKVVESDLEGYMITIHMFLAMLIVFLLLLSYFWSTETEYDDYTERKGLFILANALLVVSLVQMGLGTQLREALDVLMDEQIARSQLLEESGFIFMVHRSFSWMLVLLGMISTWFVLRASSIPPAHVKSVLVIMVLLGIQMLSGLGMQYFDVPPSMQVLHLSFAAFTITAQFYLVLQTKKPS